MRVPLPTLATLFAFAAVAWAQEPVAPPAPAPAPAAVAAPVHGRLEVHQGLQILHLYGTPAERGYAHGFLLGKQIASVAIAEFTARFARQKALLQQVRGALDRLIEYPDDVRTEIEAVFAGLCASGADLDMPELERAFDLQDLLVANALDVFGLLGCSSFTVWGDEVDGGGVLTARNFDWPLTGAHLLDATMLLVQHLPDGRATAAVTWPGYTGAVTGISKEGIAAFLHVGSAKITFTPEPGAWPSAIALRRVLEQGRADAGAATFDLAQQLLGNTSPPAGYLLHVVLPRVPTGAPPALVFETDAKSCVRSDSPTGCCVLTNHFHKRTDGREASNDSVRREQRMHDGIQTWLGEGDHKLSVTEAWDLLAAVERGGGHAFGTLHSLVFRHEPWYFELRVGAMDGKQVVAAPESPRRHVLTRAEVFGDEPAPK
jgi:hypothetical protein